MNDFNPIRDLRSPEADPFNVPAGQSTQEVEDIRLRLVLTREKTENIVKIIKNKGLVFKKDVEKIQELQRRLRKTIPRIPILRGDASVEGGSEEEITRRSFGFDLDFNRRFRTKTKVPTKDPFPFFDLIFTSIIIFLTRRGGKGIKVPPFIKNLFKGKGKGADPTTIDDILKQLDKQIKELEKAKKFVPQSLRNAKKNLELVKQNQTTAARMSAGFEKNKNVIRKGKRDANLANKLLKENKAFVKRETETIKDSIAFTKKMVKQDLAKNPVDAFENLQVARATFTSRIQGLENAIKTDKSLTKGRVKAIRQVIAELKKANKEIDDITRELSDKYPEILEEFQKNEEFMKILSGKSKLNQEQFKQLFKMLKVGGGTPLSSVNASPMSNDIAMLNTDTSYRDIIIIDRGQA